MKLTLSKKIFFILLVFTYFLNAQSIEWSPEFKGDLHESTLFNKVGNQKGFYSLEKGSGLLSSNYYLIHYDGLIKGQPNKINNLVDGVYGVFVKMIEVDGKFVSFIGSRKNGKNNLYMQVYNNKCIQETEPKLIVEYKADLYNTDITNYSIIQSENKNYFAIEYSTKGKTILNKDYCHKIFNNFFEIVDEGKIESFYENKTSVIRNHYLTNDGVLFVGIKLYKKNTSEYERVISTFENYILWLVHDNEFEEFDIKLKDKKVTELSFVSDDNGELICTGVYGEDIDASKGLFYFKIDFNNNKIYNEGYSEFKENFISKNWIERPENENSTKSKIIKQTNLYKYVVREFIKTKNNEIFVVMEQYYVYHSSFTSGYGTSFQTDFETEFEQYKDLIIYSVQKNGDFVWVNKIPKFQQAMDSHTFGSIGGYFSGNNYVFFFNDNKINYDNTGNFNANLEHIYPVVFDKETTRLARVEISIETGDFKRQKLKTPSTKKVFTVPKIYLKDYENNELIMFFRFGRKNKIAILKF
jgi:hypothetical protein